MLLRKIKVGDICVTNDGNTIRIEKNTLKNKKYPFMGINVDTFTGSYTYLKGNMHSSYDSNGINPFGGPKYAIARILSANTDLYLLED